MLTGHSQDWPLSREEKKQRLLRLYDKDLEETDRLLQMSADHLIAPTSANPASASKLRAAASKENTGDIFNITTSLTKPNAAIPGQIHDGSTCSPMFDAFVQSGSSPCKMTSAPEAPKQYEQEDCSFFVMPLAPKSQSPGGLAAPPPLPPPKVACSPGAPSSHGSSARSFEYHTPDSGPTPRTPSVHVPRPGSAPCAPSGQPRSRGKDFSVCKRTGTVIPSIPPMPTAALRNGGDAEKPCQGVDLKFSGALDQRLPDAPLPRSSSRPYSAVAANAFSACRASSAEPSRRRSEESCYPPHVLSAARHGRYAEVEAALLGGFRPNYKDSYGNTIFHIACQNGQRRIAKLVVKYGCDMNIQNQKGNTGLHFLFAYGYPDIAEYFLKKGADESIKNSCGKAAREGIK